MIESRLIWSSSSLGLAFLLAGLNLFAQTPAASQTAPNVLALRAELVLSQEFCATKKRQSIAIKDVLNVGKAACAQLYEALVPIFTDLKRIEKKSPPGNSSAQITLIPRFADISATQQPFLPSSRRKLVILLEWTIQDSAGHTIWLQTVQGSSEHKAGWIVTTKRMDGLVDAVVSDLAKDSVAKLSAARELQQLSH
jgi:hypothetical protein